MCTDVYEGVNLCSNGVKQIVLFGRRPGWSSEADWEITWQSEKKELI